MITINNPFNTNKITFDQFLINSTDLIIKSIFVYSISDNGIRINKKRVSENVVKKYKPLYENLFGYANFDSDSISILCLLIELSHSYSDLIPESNRFSIQEVLSEFAKKVESSLTKRSPIKQKVFNYLTSQIEYELEDGNFIPVDLTNLPKNILSLDIIPYPILKELDLPTYRNKKIEEIIDEN